MCENICNLKAEVRYSCVLPVGDLVSLKTLDEQFATYPCAQRGEISRCALKALASQERVEFKKQIRRAIKKHDAGDPIIELVTFLALGHYAAKTQTSIAATLEKIVAQQSGIGILLPSPVAINPDMSSCPQGAAGKPLNFTWGVPTHS